jgi:hypothetical protein
MNPQNSRLFKVVKAWVRRTAGLRPAAAGAVTAARELSTLPLKSWVLRLRRAALHGGGASMAFGLVRFVPWVMVKNPNEFKKFKVIQGC